MTIEEDGTESATDNDGTDNVNCRRFNTESSYSRCLEPVKAKERSARECQRADGSKQYDMYFADRMRHRIYGCESNPRRVRGRSSPLAGWPNSRIKVRMQDLAH